ncbi:hypothetical protein EBZ38_09355 [bacterium]|nr:hypothetical protein [bacterium]NDC94827.1 hypothetical protein [bacterium]NDD84459.1 hypothetical protein [bacterium]
MPKKKYPKSDAIENMSYQNKEAYVTWNDSDLVAKKEALSEASKGLEEFNGIQRATANSSRYRDFSKLLPNISGRPGLTRSDYDFFRPDEAVPGEIKAIFMAADNVYNRVGLVKNVIDLMGDFACQGIRLVHPNKRIEKFYRNWFDKIRGEDRSERFLNNLYKVGNVVINRQTAKISLKVTDNLYRSIASPDLIINSEEAKVEKREIPWRYTFIDPTYVDVIGGSLSSFVSNKTYAINMPPMLRKIINSPKNDAERAIIDQLPPQIIEAAKTKKPYILDPDKTLVYHYKKDDWQMWSYPMVYAILDDINIIEKLKLADIAALDGAISNIRIFKLGSLEHKIAPTAAAASKLGDILQNNVGGGTMDLVWGPDIELIESKTSVHQFLGEAKYTPHLNSIYAGLGIPPTLTGTYGASGTTNNFISLKTLTQRLQYGRKVLSAFWKNEIALVQKAMGFKYPAKIEFDRMDLSNEDAEKALLVQLADRNIVSDELVQRIFGFDPDMEKVRLNKEHRDRENERMIPKSGPWHDPQTEQSLQKIALQTGLATPSQVDLELKPKKKGEKTLLELKAENTPVKSPSPFGGDVSSPSKPGQPQQGRPKTSKDTQKRKQKNFSPQTGASVQIWALEAQDKITNIINPYLIEFYHKKNMRSLSSSEYEEAENTKTKLLFMLEPLSTISEELLLAKLNTINSIDVCSLHNEFKQWIKSTSSTLNKPLTAEEQKHMKAYFYSLVYSNTDINNEG